MGLRGKELVNNGHLGSMTIQQKDSSAREQPRQFEGVVGCMVNLSKSTCHILRIVMIVILIFVSLSVLPNCKAGVRILGPFSLGLS